MNNKDIKKTSLMIRKHLFKHKPYEDFDKCYLCGKNLNYRNSRIVLVTDDFLPACACKNCREEIKIVKDTLHKHYKTRKFSNYNDFLNTFNKDFDVWVKIKRNKNLFEKI